MGRFILIVLALVVIAGIAAVWSGFVNLSGQPGELPRVEGGRLPTVNADVGAIEVGTSNTTVEVPKVETTTERVELPKVEVRKPGE